MQFSYMKLAIYALTFLTYAYSGYGSSTIASLRDAIIAAEAIFGDVFHNVITVARKFKVVHEVFDAAVDENCIFTCPGDVKSVQNKMYTPSSDGCGSLGLSISTEYLPAAEMGACCNEHDICYDTCNSDKELCDLDFKRCLYRHCETYDKTIASDIVIKSCKGAAKMLFTGTLTLGCKSFLDAQKRTCYCPPPKESKYQKNNNNNNNNNNKNNNNNNNNNKNYKDKKQKYGWKDEF